MTEADMLVPVLARLAQGQGTDADIDLLRRSLLGGQVALASAERAISIGGDANDALVISGDGNVVGVFKGADALSIQRVFLRTLESIRDERFDRSLQDYLRAVREHSADVSYLALYGEVQEGSGDSQGRPCILLPVRRALSVGQLGKTETKAKEPLTPLESLVVEPRNSETIADMLRQTLGVSAEKHLLITGGPGAGKSTLLRYIAQYAWDAPSELGLGHRYLPMIVPLRWLAQAKGASVERRLLDALRQASELTLQEDPPADFFDTWPRRQGVSWLLLLDGLDEVPTDKGRYSALVQWLQNVIETPLFKERAHRVVITSRPGAVLGQVWGARFSHYEAVPFDEQEQKQFAQCWFTDRAGQFLEELDRAEVSTLCDTPLLLTIAASIYREDGRVPEQRGRLYERFVSVLLLEAAQRGLEQELGVELVDVVRPSLEHLALVMLERQEAPTVENLGRIVTRYLQDELSMPGALALTRGARLVEVLGRRSGVFIRRGTVCDWVHPTFRDYLAACALATRYSPDQAEAWTFTSRWSQENWTEVIIFLLSVWSTAGQDVTAVLHKIAESGDGGRAFVVAALLTEGIQFNNRPVQDMAHLAGFFSERGLGLADVVLIADHLMAQQRWGAAAQVLKFVVSQPRLDAEMRLILVGVMEEFRLPGWREGFMTLVDEVQLSLTPVFQAEPNSPHTSADGPKAPVVPGVESS